MKVKLLPILLVGLLTECDQSLVKDLTIDGSLINDAFATTAEVDFSLNTFEFCYKGVSSNDNDQFVFSPEGYIRSSSGVPYSYLVVESNELSVYGYSEKDEYSDALFNSIKLDINKADDNTGGYTYYLKGNKNFYIKNETSSDITISKLYFYSAD